MMKIKFTSQQIMSTNNQVTSPAVLVSSASKKISLIAVAKEAMQRINPHATVIAGDISPTALTSYVVDDFWLMPKTEDAMFAEILAGCLLRNIQIVLPTRDGELIFWAKHAKTFEDNGIHVIISPQDAIAKCIDKLAFAEFGSANALPVISTSDDVEVLTANRYVVKERFGAGSREIGIDLDQAQAKKYAATLTNPIYQPFIQGLEFSADAWLDKLHHVKGLVLRERNLVVNGESQVTTTFTNSVLENQIKHCLEKLKLRGPVVLQAILDQHNKMHIIECNVRFGGASNAGIAAGVDSVYWSILEATGHDVNKVPFKRLNGELRQVRISTDVYKYGPHF